MATSQSDPAADPAVSGSATITLFRRQRERRASNASKRLRLYAYGRVADFLRLPFDGSQRWCSEKLELDTLCGRS